MTTSTLAPARVAPPLDEAEREALRAFAAVLDRLRPRVDAAVEEAAQRIPVFARLLDTLDPAVREQQGAQSRALEHGALADGEWAPYLAHLRGMGSMYALLGIEFEDWYGLLRPYRDVVHAELLPVAGENERAALSGMGIFLDRAMATIGASYVEAKQALVRTAEEQLDLYVQLFTETPSGTLILEWNDGALRVVATNSAAAAMSGGRLLDAAGKTLAEIGGSWDDGSLVEHAARAAQTGEPQRWSWRSRSEGDERVYDGRCFRLGTTHVGAFFDDVTERRLLQEALARHAADLERSNRDLDEFAYVASHDLKAPLRDVDTLAGWIEEDAADSLAGGARRHLKTLRDRIARMERLLDDLLHYSRAGRMRHAPEELDARRLVEEAVAFAAFPPGFTVHVAGTPPVIRAPRVPLELVVRNLLANAAKHHDRPDGRVEVTLRGIDDGVEIGVADDGPGIAPEYHERIFAMFQTLKPRDEVEGSGMGLAVVKKMVEAHGGRVRVESAGRGATFTVTWPTGARRSE